MSSSSVTTVCGDDDHMGLVGQLFSETACKKITLMSNIQPILLPPTAAMESPEAKEKKLFEDGVFWASDSHVGDDVAELEKRGFPYYSEYSLDVCQRHVLNEVMKPTSVEMQG